MAKSKDPLLRAALLIHRRLLRQGNSGHDPLSRLGANLADACRSLCRAWEHQCLARRRGWRFAAARLSEDLTNNAQRVREAAEALPRGHARPTHPPPSPQVLWAELRQLHEEFESVQVNADGDGEGPLILVRTEPIELEGVHLGPFAIELHLDRLHRADSFCFDCVALEPYPAQNSASVTHPHVQDKMLCAGDASAAINEALRQGRLCDAFLLVAGVLRNYNPRSPYVSLEDWNGVSCADCQATVDRDDLHYCEHCDRDLCDDCSGVCDVCVTSCCHSCLEYDEEACQSCCPNCRSCCARCGRWVSRETFDVPGSLCPQCRENNQQPQPQEVDDEQSTGSTLPEGKPEAAAA